VLTLISPLHRVRLPVGVFIKFSPDPRKAGWWCNGATGRAFYSGERDTQKYRVLHKISLTLPTTVSLRSRGGVGFSRYSWIHVVFVAVVVLALKGRYHQGTSRIMSGRKVKEV
jgi:hypothetical protein